MSLTRASCQLVGRCCVPKPLSSTFSSLTAVLNLSSNGNVRDMLLARHLSSRSKSFGGDGEGRGGNEYDRSSGGDGGGGGKRNPILRFPKHNTREEMQSQQQQVTNPALDGGRGTRPHSLLVFPGDYSDEHDYSSLWEDDDDELEQKQEVSSSEEMNAIREEIKRRRQEEKEKRARWLANSQPPVRVPIIDDRGRSYGRGGRKTASARVWIQPGVGEIVVNRQHFVDYFQRMSDREHVLYPFVATKTCGLFDVQVAVEGGGLTGKAGAIRHGIARALNAYNPDAYRPFLKKLGFLTRDPRMVERKKVGLKKARKAPQWVRR